jgi:hypothetical protein
MRASINERMAGSSGPIVADGPGVVTGYGDQVLQWGRQKGMRMSQDTPVSPAAEARFQALAASIDQDTWAKLIGHASDHLLKRLATAGMMADVDMGQLQLARELIGEVLVGYTNVTLTCVAQAELGELKPEATP